MMGVYYSCMILLELSNLKQYQNLIPTLNLNTTLYLHILRIFSTLYFMLCVTLVYHLY